MNSVCVTVHRSTREIGGNCVEIATNTGGRLILDVGRPLDASSDATNLVAKSLDLSRPVDGILISHAHQDHYGLLNETPPDWPVYCGEPTARLMRMTSAIAGRRISRNLRAWKSGVAMEIGPFRVTPYLTDHSAFDAHMLLIEVGGKRILYSGDFRTHGRKSVLVERLMNDPPPNLDVLLMEGTNLGSDKPWISEDDLQDDFVRLFEQTEGRVFVAWSGQNIDRTVTLYKACCGTGRTLVVDLYAAEVLDMLKEFGRIPQPGWPNLKVVITRAMRRKYASDGKETFIARMANAGLSVNTLAGSPMKSVIMVRPSLMRDYERGGLTPQPQDAWCWSMWRGYLAKDDVNSLSHWFTAAGAMARHLHTSGHAAPDRLRAFAHSMNPRWMVPIHGTAWDVAGDGFPPIRRLHDGEAFRL